MFFENMEYDLIMICGHTQKRKMSLDRANFLNDRGLIPEMYFKYVRGVGLCLECNKQDAINRGYPSGTVLY